MLQESREVLLIRCRHFTVSHFQVLEDPQPVELFVACPHKLQRVTCIFTQGLKGILFTELCFQEFCDRRGSGLQIKFRKKAIVSDISSKKRLGYIG